MLSMMFSLIASKGIIRYTYKKNSTQLGYKGGDLHILMDQTVHAYTMSDFNFAIWKN